MNRASAQPRLDRYLRSLAATPLTGETSQVEALQVLCDYLPDGRLALVGVGDESFEVGMDTRRRIPCVAPPAGGLIRRVVTAGETVFIRAHAGRLYRDVGLDLYLGDDELFVAPVMVRDRAVAAMILSAPEITAGVRHMVAVAAAAIGLRLTLSGGGRQGRERSKQRLARAQALAGAGRVVDALNEAARAFDLRADILPSSEPGGLVRSCTCPHHRTLEVTAGSELLGRVLLHGWSPVHDDASDWIAATMRTALLAQRLQASAPIVIPRTFLDFGAVSDPPWEAAGSISIELAAPLTVVLVSRRAGHGVNGEADLLAAVSTTLGPGAARTPMGRRAGEVLVVLARHDASASHRFAGRVCERARRSSTGAVCFVSQAGSPADLDRLVVEVERLARLDRFLHLDLDVVDAAVVGSYGLLLDVGSPERLAAWADDLIGPLIAYDAKHGGDLVGTLEAYLRAWGQITRCSATLYVHPNTLKYRLQRIRDILGADPRDVDARGDLLLACYARRVANALGAPVPGPPESSQGMGVLAAPHASVRLLRSV
jgi:hypothetical protein